jgi:hypothetical protein
MTMNKLVLLAPIMASVLPNPASACRMPTPIFRPMAQSSDAIVVGRVLNEVATSGIVYADVEITQVAYGSYPEERYRLTWYVYDGRGACAPKGPDVKKGDEVAIYLVRRSGNFVPQGWMIAREAAEEDQRVRTALRQ